MADIVLKAVIHNPIDLAPATKNKPIHGQR
jgi:hypothetical protein